MKEQVEQVWEEHGYMFEEQTCTCGEPLHSYSDAELHFAIEVYKVGYKAGQEKEAT